MIELEFKNSIDHESVQNLSADQLEETLNEQIMQGLLKQIKAHLDEMSFIDIAHNPEIGGFDYKASLVLCSKQNIISNAEVMAQKLALCGVREEDILDVLSTMQEDLGGF